MDDLLKTVLSVGLGGLSGAFINYWFLTGRQKKLELSISLSKDYSGKFELLSNVTKFLTDPTTKREDRDKVRDLGNWFLMVVVLYQRREVDRGLLYEVGIITGLERFVKAIENSNHPNFVTYLEDEQAWKRLKLFVKKSNLERSKKLHQSSKQVKTG